MKRKFLAIAIALVTLGSATSFAQEVCGKKGRACQTQQCVDSQSATADNKMYKPQKFTDYAFEGILLTVDQQGKMDKLNADLKAKREACKNDTTACQKQCKGDRKCRGERRLQARKDYVNSVKEILTPEQYTTFLENIVFMPEQPKCFGQRHKAPRRDMNYKEHRRHDGEKAQKIDKSNIKVTKAEKSARR